MTGSIVAAGLAAGRAAAGDLPEVRVVAKAPYGAVQDISAAAAITATFNQPMAPLTSAEKAALKCPAEVFSVEDVTDENYTGPADAALDTFKKLSSVKGRCRWQGTHVLAFEPAAALKPASVYAVRINKGVKSEVSGGQLAEDEVWFFETPRPALFNSSPYNNQRWVALDSQVYAAFTLPMDPSRARQALELTGRGPDGASVQIPAGVRRAKEDEVKKLWPYYHNISTATVLAIKPSGGLKADFAYTLKFKQGLRSAQGVLGLAQAREVNFSAYRTFGITAMPQDHCLPAGYSLAFSNPVRYGEFYKHLSVEPQVKFPPRGDDSEYSGGDQYGGEDSASVYLPDIDFKPDTLYRFKLSGELADIFGNKLGADREFEIRTQDYCPSFVMPGGFGVLEGYLPPRHPAEAVNAAPVNIVKGLVQPEDFIPFYSGGMVNDSVLKNKVEKLWEPSSGLRNARLRTFLDYGDVIAKDQGGLLFARVPTQREYSITALDNVTRLALTFKTSPDSSFIWTTYLKTGRPVANTPVEIRDDANKVLWTGTTDKTGFADAPGWLKLGITDWARWRRPDLWLFARHPNGAAVMNSGWTRGIEPWRFSINYDYYPRPRRYGAALFTERGIYRPGETVNLKGVGRKLSGGDWEALDIKTVQVSITDSRGNRVLKATAPVSQLYSSFDYSYALAESAPTGVWTAEVSEPYEDDKTTARAVEEDEEGSYRDYQGKERPFLFTETFRVEAFKPAVFEVKAQALKESYLLGGKFSAAIEGWYLFGAPMSGSKTDWTLRLEPGHYSPPGCDDFTFGSYEDHQGFSGRQAGAGGAELDAKGKALAETDLPKTLPGAGAVSATLEAGVTDPERQRLFGRARAWVHRANVYFGLKASGGFLDAGKPWHAEIVSVRPDGSAVTGIKGEAKLIKRQWLSSRRAGLGGRLEWVSEVKDTVVSSSAFVSSGSTDTWTYTPAEGGYYIFTVSGTDEEGRSNASSFSFYVLGGGDSWWAREDSDIIELAAEKTEYKPGDTARILVKSPYAEALALVTVEREGVMDRWTVVTKGGSDFIQVPIKEKYLPNAYVSVILVKGRAAEQKYSEDGDSDLSKPQAKFGYVNLNVNPGGRRLKVSVKSARPKYRPGDTVELEVRATDESGRPVQAEAAVFAVDEGVLSLTGYATPDLFSPFYGPRPLNVMTVDSRLHVIGQRSYGEKGEARGGGGGAALAGIDLRSKFVPTAYWNPSVLTGPDGYARVSFKLPDNLTRFRLMAAASEGRRFGSGDSSLTVSKPLMLRPSLPRLARPGDTFDCGAVLHNYSELVSSVTLAVELTGDAVSMTGERRRQASVDGGKAAELVWQCKAEKPGTTVFKFRAKAGPETDGLEWKLPVRVREPVEYAATSGVTESTAAQALQIPYKGAAGQVAFTLSPSALSGLEEGTRYLLEYPYGCLE
ncbi:MAG: MG2 domain-containing protein, partial [Elusimicrobia bacterium]|nr:MG2 domain-containing protein [Elusimicrobiota bacterium]